MTAFFVVWCPTGPHSPWYRHMSHDSALREAKRMAGEHPGREFFVLQATNRALVAEVRVEALEPPPAPPSPHDCDSDQTPSLVPTTCTKSDDDIPF
jgi:hypothetical protein